MGIVGVETFMESLFVTFPEVDIVNLIGTNCRRVIVVDGNVFIESYLYRKFPWIVCGTRVYAENIRAFVQTFTNLGVKLVFFFTEFCVIDPDTKWKENRDEIVETSKAILREMENRNPVPLEISQRNTPLTHDVTCWTISVLKYLNCEVTCPIQDRVWKMARYAWANDCLAIFSHNADFVFFQNYNTYILSLRHLDLENMKTRQYNIDELSWELKLYSKFYPLLATFLGSTNTCLNERRTFVLSRIREKVSHPVEGWDILYIARYIRENYDRDRLDNIPNIIRQHFPSDAQWITKRYLKYAKLFSFRTGERQNFALAETESDMLEKIKMRCRELTICGKICGRIRYVIQRRCFEQFFSLDDFEEFPPSSVVYLKLRKNMYGILLRPTKRNNVYEKCVKVLPTSTERVLASQVNETLHPGLLALWDDTIQDERLTDTKCRLFAAAISPQLDHRVLRYLPKCLVVPVAVLYYLIQMLPTLSSDLQSRLEAWEIKAFLTVALTLCSTDEDNIRYIPNQIGNVRAVRLANLFVQGCDITRLVAQSCGLFLGDIDAYVWKYFDGKLFNRLYDETFWSIRLRDNILSSENSILLNSIFSILETAYNV